MNDSAELPPKEEANVGLSLAARMKDYETAALRQVHLNPTLPYVVRLDGHCFSHFTEGFQKPYDMRLYEAMDKTCEDLFRTFHPATIYTQSDEISLLFAPHPYGPPHPQTGERTYRELPFKGRILKMSTLMAAYATARLNYHLQCLLRDDPHLTYMELSNANTHTTHGKLLDKIGLAYFDGRAFSLPDAVEVYNYICWRARHDAYRNAISSVARQYFSAKQLYKLNSTQKLEALRQKGIDYENTIDERHQFGRYFKREAYLLQTLNQHTGELVAAVRHRPFGFCQPFPRGFDASFTRLLLTKYVNKEEDENETYLVPNSLSAPCKLPTPPPKILDERRSDDKAESSDDSNSEPLELEDITAKFQTFCRNRGEGARCLLFTDKDQRIWECHVTEEGIVQRLHGRYRHYVQLLEFIGPEFVEVKDIRLAYYRPDGLVDVIGIVGVNDDSISVNIVDGMGRTARTWPRRGSEHIKLQFKSSESLSQADVMSGGDCGSPIVSNRRHEK